MKIVLGLLIIFISNFSLSQDLSCNDFKKGVFYIEIKEKFDTLYLLEEPINKLSKFLVENEEKGRIYKMIRNQNEQVEWIVEREEEGFTYEDSNWIDDCTYILKYSSKNADISEDQLDVNIYGGLVVSLSEIENNCIKYKASVFYENKSEIYNVGYLCKEQ